MALPYTNLKDNSTPNPIARQDVGVKLSQPFYDVNTTSDSNLVFSSGWPSLAVAASGICDGSGKIAHNLGFPPFSLGWANTPATMVFPDMDSTYLYSNPGDYVVAYDLDITKDVDYAYTAASSVVQPYDNGYGIKMAIEGKNIDSTDLRDFIVHSRAQSPLVLAVKTEISADAANVAIAGSPTIQYTNKVGYQTWVFGYVYLNASSRYAFAPMYSQAYPRLFTDGIKSYLTYFDNKASLVILRDPMFAPTTRSVTY